EPSHGGITLEEVPVEITVFDPEAQVETVESADGARIKTEGGQKRIDRTAYTSKLELVFSEGEAIYGLGQHEEGILNYRGHQQMLYQHNMKLAVPMIVSTRGYALLWDTYSLSVFHDDEHGSYFWSDIDDELDFTFIYGPEFDQIVAHYRTLTGQVPMLPKWAFGYVQSKERYIDQEELLAIAREYRSRSIPIDCIVQDWRTWPEGLWGQKTFDASRFPDPEHLTDELHQIGVKMMVSIWPHMRGNGPNQEEMRAQGYLLGNQSTYNAFDPDARALYWQQANEGLFQYGINAWWCDCTEPFEKDWRGVIKPEPWKRAVVNTDEAKTYLDPAYINAYSLLHSQMIYEGQRGVTEKKRVVNLTRSYSPGQQRYGTIVWSGDIAAQWDTLRKQIADGLNFAVTGGSKWTLDIGAFFVTPMEQGQVQAWFWCGEFPDGCMDEGYRELYVRWFQLGAFLPMFRSHGTDTPREIWRFGAPGDRTYDTLVAFDVLRYRLLPYIYSVAGWETHRGYTMLRNLAFDFRHDPAVYDIADQFMFGPHLLVCPVTNPMYYGPGSAPLSDIPETRTVYLPAGCDWYDFWTGKRYHGGQSIAAAAPLEICPLFVRAGSIIPLGPRVQHSGELPDAPWELRVYPGADGTFDIYEDEGDNYNYENGAYAWTSIRWDNASRILIFNPRQGSYPGMNQQREFQIVLVSENHGTGVEQESQIDAVVIYSGNQVNKKLAHTM
ncbi:MAG: glycoside hydrolase family 31 protein, partial [Anaerolineae bacterium]|nr:glycoside hydrolase family 31 protein [Anaerolineae bacterium]